MHRFRTFAILAVLGILTTIGCDGREAATAPDGPVGVAPQFGKGNGTDNGNGGGSGGAPTGPVWGDDGTGYAEAIIGPEGGSLSAGEHRLTVPAGAVPSPTKFTLELTGETTISVELSATALGSAHPNDVGGRGFQKTLHLDLSYTTATRGYDLNRLHIAWQSPDGTLQPIGSHVFRAQKLVRGYLNHFSGYIIAD